MIKAVLLDMDDCLIIKQKLFDKAQRKLFEYVSYFGFSVEDVSEKFDIVDTEMFKTHGFLPERLVNSFEVVLRHFVPDVDSEMVDIVHGFANDVFNSTAQLKPGVEDAVNFLIAHYPVYIVTQGDKKVQEGFLSQLPFRNKLSGEFIVEKNRETYSSIVQKLGHKPYEVIMVGDSVKSDIIPSHEAGMRVCWIPSHNSPLHDKSETGLPEGASQFNSLLEAVYSLVRGELSVVVGNNNGGEFAKQIVPPVSEGNISPLSKVW